MTRPLRPTRVPDDELRAIYDEVVAVGSQRAVAIAHGWNQAKVRHRVLSWMRHAGIEGDPPGITSQSHRQRGSLSHSGLGDRSAWKRSARRIVELEAENAALRARIARLEAEARPFARLEAKLDALAARPDGRLLVIDHRRRADGGTSRREQVRAARSA